MRFLGKEGFDPEFGARPLRRTIQRLVENELSRMVLAGTVEPGDKVVVDRDDDKLRFEVETGRASEFQDAEAGAERAEPVESGRS